MAEDKTFDDWYDTFESDGGELLCYNSIDLQSAWDARQPEIDALKAEVKKLKEENLRLSGYDEGDQEWQQALGVSP